jgi:hypothetical protein
VRTLLIQKSNLEPKSRYFRESERFIEKIWFRTETIRFQIMRNLIIMTLSTGQSPHRQANRRADGGDQRELSFFLRF